MTSYYDILKILKTEIEATQLVNTITQGNLDNRNINKQDLYPLCNIEVTNARFIGATIVFSITLECVDVLDISKEETTDLFRGNDNEIDVLNSTITILNRIFERLRRKIQGEQISDADLQPSFNIYMDGCSGWQMTFDITIPANMPIC